MAIDLRRSQAQRIKAQQGPDGTAYPARKRRKEFQGKNGRIKRQKAAMFAKIRTAKHLKVKATDDQLEVGFFGWVARVARVHQFGRQESVANPTLGAMAIICLVKLILMRMAASQKSLAK